MSFDTISARLAAFQETTTQLQTLINRLATIKFQPGSIPLDGLKGDVCAELIQEIHQTIKDQDEDLEALRQDVVELPSGRPGSELERDKHALEEVARKAGLELNAAQIAFRKAQLSAKSALEEAKRLERSLVLEALIAPRPDSSASSPNTSQILPPRRYNTTPNPPQSKDEKLLNATSDVTLALRRTHALMSNELSRSHFAHQTLQESTAALSELSESYTSLDSMLKASKNLLSTLLRSQKSDTWYLETAFYILAVTIGWLVFRRWIYGPAWWLLWLPLKLFWKAWMGVFAVLGLRGRDGITEMGYADVVKEAVGANGAGQRAATGVEGIKEVPTINTPVTHGLGTRKPRQPGHTNVPPNINTGGGKKKPLQYVQDVGDMVEQKEEAYKGAFEYERMQRERVEREKREAEEAANDIEKEQTVLRETVEELGKDETVLEERPDDMPPNPKKRVWDENVEGFGEEQRNEAEQHIRDEL